MVNTPVFVSHRCLLFQLQTLFWLAAQPHDCVNSLPWSQNRYVSQEPNKEGFLTRQMKCKYSVKHYSNIKNPKTEVSWLKSTLVYSENDERLKVLSIGKSGFWSQNQDLPISNRTQNLKTDFVADSLIENLFRVRISVNEIRREIRFQILCSIGNPKIRILRSKSGFTNRKHPNNLSHSSFSWHKVITCTFMVA